MRQKVGPLVSLLLVSLALLGAGPVVGDYDAALESARQMQASARKARILARVAQARIMQGRGQEAKELLSEAVTMATIADRRVYDDVEAFFEIGEAFLKMEDWGRAAGSFERAMNKDEEKADIPFPERNSCVNLIRDYSFYIAAKVALAYVEAGDFDKALTLCDERRTDIYGKDSNAAAAVVLTKIALEYKARNEPRRAWEAIDDALARAEAVTNEDLRQRLRDDITLVRDTQIRQK